MKKKSPILASLEKWQSWLPGPHFCTETLGWSRSVVVAPVTTTPKCLPHGGVNVSCCFNTCRELCICSHVSVRRRKVKAGQRGPHLQEEAERTHSASPAHRPPGLAPTRAPIGRCVCGCSTTRGLIFCHHISLPASQLSCSFLPWSRFLSPAL